MQGGIHIARPPWSPTSPAQGGALLYARLRYFDPERRRAGVPEDVAALVETLSDDGVTVSLVNTNQVAARTVTVQGGGYGEHQVLSVATDGGPPVAVNASAFTVRLAAGSGGAADAEDEAARQRADPELPLGPGLEKRCPFAPSPGGERAYAQRMANKLSRFQRTKLSRRRSVLTPPDRPYPACT
jgi:hypothetical protein